MFIVFILKNDSISTENTLYTLKHDYIWCLSSFFLFFFLFLVYHEGTASQLVDFETGSVCSFHDLFLLPQLYNPLE